MYIIEGTRKEVYHDSSLKSPVATVINFFCTGLLLTFSKKSQLSFSKKGATFFTATKNTLFWLNIYLFSTSTQKMVKLNLAFNPVHTNRSWISKVTLGSKYWSQEEMLLASEGLYKEESAWESHKQ